MFTDNLHAETKRQIYQEHRRGEPVEALARRFGWSPSRIYSIVNEVQAARILVLPLNYVDNGRFHCLGSNDSACQILGPQPASDLAAKKPRLPGGLPAYLAGLYDVPLLTREQEAHLFLKMNYLKRQAGKLRETLGAQRPTRRLMDRIEKLYENSVAAKNRIVSANLRLVVSIVKRYVGMAEGFFELVSDGNLTLLRAAEKFDVSLGNRFNTYATWAIMRNFARSIPLVLRHRDRFCTDHPEVSSSIVDLRAGQREQELEQFEFESQVKALVGCLDEREMQIVVARFGLDRGQEPLTLKQVGIAMGVTKERIRQIQARAMDKLRRAAAEEEINRGAEIIVNDPLHLALAGIE